MTKILLTYNGYFWGFNVTTAHISVTGHNSNDIIDVTELKNTPQGACTQLKNLYYVISTRFIPNLVIFQTITRYKFRNKPHASKEVYRQIYHIFHGYSDKNLHFPHINIPQVYLRQNYGEKVLISFQNPFLDVETAFRHAFPSSDQQCLSPSDPIVLCT